MRLELFGRVTGLQDFFQHARRKHSLITGAGSLGSQRQCMLITFFLFCFHGEAKSIENLIQLAITQIVERSVFRIRINSDISFLCWNVRTDPIFASSFKHLWHLQRHLICIKALTMLNAMLIKIKSKLPVQSCFCNEVLHFHFYKDSNEPGDCFPLR